MAAAARAVAPAMPTHVHVCTSADVDETAGAAAPREERTSLMGLREAVMAAYEVPRAFYRIGGPPKRLYSVGALFYYGIEVQPRRRGAKPVNIDEMIDRWEEVVVGLALAHDKDQGDEFEAQINTILTPLLTAPSAQLREFFARLVERLKANERVPYLIWRSLEVWQERMVAGAPDEGIKRLKRALAEEIATMVEPETRHDIRDAMINALMWRDPERLEEVRDALRANKEKTGKTGARVRGRESCLFLEVGRGRGRPRATVQL